MANVVYNAFKAKIMDGSIDLDTDAIKVALVRSTYTPNIDSHVYFSDITGEASGAGYTAGGKSLASLSIAIDNTDDEGAFDAADVTWSNSTITARGAVVYKDTGNAATSPLICYFDFGSDKSSENGDFTIQWGSEGVLNLN